MIKFFRRIRQNLLNKNKVGKYLLYAIGEIILVVIGILIALSINNWNEKQKEKKQIRNIYIRIIQDFNNSVKEIDKEIAWMDNKSLLRENILNGDVNRDSLLTNLEYFDKYYSTIGGFPDIQIIDTGIRLLEAKIELNYELNNNLSEALSLLYSQHLYEIIIDQESLSDWYLKLQTYKVEKGIVVDYKVHDIRTTFVNMIFEDNMFKNYFERFSGSWNGYSKKLNQFKTQGTILIDKIKTEYNLE